MIAPTNSPDEAKASPGYGGNQERQAPLQGLAFEGSEVQGQAVERASPFA